MKRSAGMLDRAGWFDVETARRKAFASQGPFFGRLLEALGGG